ncbi:MAG: MBL fold metallo-hydrolase [Methanobacterium sp.]
MGNIVAEGISKISKSSVELKPDILLLNFKITALCIIGDPANGNKEWVLVDTGMENSADYIIKKAKERFGENNPPKSIILTHGHFDHVGSIFKLLKMWDVSIYAHTLEMPYITGKKDYPEGDPRVGAGMVALISPTFPNKSIDLCKSVLELPADGSVPGMPEWEWIHTPWHTEGRVCLYRQKDGVIIAGDALTTLKQESLKSVITMNEEIKGPPAYLTKDWEAAKKSIIKIRDLNPSLLIPSHGNPLEGQELKDQLNNLIRDFEEISVPKRGKFIEK